MKEMVLELSKKFWDGMLYADEKAMRDVADPACYFVHIGMNADLDHEIKAFTRKIFQPTDITIHNQEVKEFGDVAICLTDVDYGLLLGGNPTTHDPKAKTLEVNWSHLSNYADWVFRP